MSITHVFSLLGGLALFLYGMDLMGKSLERQAGSRLQKILSRLTENPFKGFLLGLAVTAVIQSSSATTVMVVGFVNSGIMELHQAIGIIMGSNVGTTVTSWILSLTGLEGDSLLIQLLNAVFVRRREEKGRRRHPDRLCHPDDRHDRHVGRRFPAGK